MSFLSENTQAQTALSGALSAGLDNIRYNQSIDFVPYVRLVLPLDGFVFWVRYDQVGASTLEAASLDASGLEPVTVPCSLHIATDTDQSEEENLDVSNIVVTAKQEIRAFHDAALNVMWLGEFEGVRFAINSRKSFYQQAELYHYVGKTVFPSMVTQIIDDASSFDMSTLVLSNSTALWLSLASLAQDAVWLPGFSFPLFPKFLIPDNQEPVYGVILPVEGSQTAVAAGPDYAPNYSRNQFVEEEVDIVLYGCQNKQAADFLDTILGLSLMETTFGVSNSPVIKDESRQQTELSVLAQKKRLTFKVNYYQSQARDMAIRYILKCVPNITVEF